MKTIKWVLILLAFGIVILFLLQVTPVFLHSKQTVDTKRDFLNKTYFLPNSTGYDSTTKREIMETEAYKKYRSTKNIDSLMLYLKQAESQVIKR